MKKYSASAAMHIANRTLAPRANGVTVRSEVISLTGVTPSDDLPSDKQARCSVSKKPTNIDALGQAWGRRLRYQPNGWHSKSQWVVLVEEAIAGENSITQIAFDLSYGDEPLSSGAGNNNGGGLYAVSAYGTDLVLV